MRPKKLKVGPYKAAGIKREWVAAVTAMLAKVQEYAKEKQQDLKVKDSAQMAVAKGIVGPIYAMFGLHTRDLEMVIQNNTFYKDFCKQIDEGKLKISRTKFIVGMFALRDGMQGAFKKNSSLHGKLEDLTNPLIQPLRENWRSDPKYRESSAAIRFFESFEYESEDEKVKVTDFYRGFRTNQFTFRGNNGEERTLSLSSRWVKECAEAQFEKEKKARSNLDKDTKRESATPTATQSTTQSEAAASNRIPQQTPSMSSRVKAFPGDKYTATGVKREWVETLTQILKETTAYAKEKRKQLNSPHSAQMRIALGVVAPIYRMFGLNTENLPKKIIKGDFYIDLCKEIDTGKIRINPVNFESEMFILDAGIKVANDQGSQLDLRLKPLAEKLNEPLRQFDKSPPEKSATSTATQLDMQIRVEQIEDQMRAITAIVQASPDYKDIANILKHKMTEPLWTKKDSGEPIKLVTNPTTIEDAKEIEKNLRKYFQEKGLPQEKIPSMEVKPSSKDPTKYRVNIHADQMLVALYFLNNQKVSMQGQDFSQFIDNSAYLNYSLGILKGHPDSGKIANILEILNLDRTPSALRGEKVIIGSNLTTDEGARKIMIKLEDYFKENGVPPPSMKVQNSNSDPTKCRVYIDLEQMMAALEVVKDIQAAQRYVEEGLGNNAANSNVTITYDKPTDKYRVSISNDDGTSPKKEYQLSPDSLKKLADIQYKNESPQQNPGTPGNNTQNERTVVLDKRTSTQPSASSSLGQQQPPHVNSEQQPVSAEVETGNTMRPK